MSASTEKKIRKAEQEAGVSKKSAAKLEAEKAEAKSKRSWTIGIIIFALVIVLALILNSGVLSKAGTAVKINGEAISPAEVSYYVNEQKNYYTQYSQMYSSYYGFDLSSMYSDEDYEKMGLEMLSQVKAMCSYAAENGVTLEESDKQKIKDDMASLEQQVLAAGSFTSLDNYYEYIYGTGVNSKLVEKAMQEQALADKAYEAKEATFTYTDAELDAKYAEYAGSKDKYDYLYYYVAGETTEGEPDEDGNVETIVTEEALAEAKATADAIISAYNSGEAEDFEERLNVAIADQGIIDSCSSGSNTAGASLNSAYSDWMMDASRKAGDINSAADSSSKGYYVAVFLSKNVNDYNTVSMRHILIKAVADENGEYSEEAKAAANAAAAEIYNQWKSGDATEDSFAALANEKTEDTGSNTNGGLYENIYDGQMVPEINDWIFAQRSVGDVEVIDVESSGYTGTHIVYFTGAGMRYDRYLAKEDLDSDALAAWTEELTAAFASEKAWAYGLIGK